MTFPYYPEYKDSDVEWLGSVPAHWKVQRLRYVMTTNPSKSEARVLPSDTVVSFIPMEAIGDDGGLDLSQTRLVDDVLGGYTYVREGDVAVAKITPCFENGKAAIMRGLVNRVGFGTTELTIVRPKPSCTNSDYLFRVVTSEPFRALGEASMYGAGGQKRVPDDFVRDFRIAWPPIEEQIVIATFLDHETARIDALIEEQRQLIELLQEKRQAVISHAVTKGLDSGVPMKDSGVESLGNIPEHWNTVKLGFCSISKSDGPFGSAITSKHYVESGVRVIRLQNIRNAFFDGSDAAFIDKEYCHQTINRSDVKPDDLLIAGLGDDNNPVGRSCVAPSWIDDAIVKADCFRFRLNTDIVEPEFAALQLTSTARADGGRMASGSTRQRIPLMTMAQRKMAIPPKIEQRDIINEIYKKIESVDSLMNKSQEVVALLFERKSALISAAVTGKIDVRQWQSQEGVEPPNYAMVAAEPAGYGAAP